MKQIPMCTVLIQEISTTYIQHMPNFHRFGIHHPVVWKSVVKYEAQTTEPFHISSTYILRRNRNFQCFTM